MLLGSGLSCEVDVFEFSTLGPKKTGTCTVDPNGKSAWVQDNRYDLKYGFERGPNWKLGRCIWAQHGVWDDTTNTLLKKTTLDLTQILANRFQKNHLLINTGSDIGVNSSWEFVR